MNSPLLITGNVLGTVLARQERRKKRVAWLRSLWPQSPLWRALIILCLIIWFLALSVWAYALLGL